MNEKFLNTNVEFEFCDGTKTTMTLAFYKLYQLKGKNKALYEQYNKIMAKKNPDELEIITVLYAAYVCAHLDEEVMNEEDFMMLCGSDRAAINKASVDLLQPKKH